MFTVSDVPSAKADAHAYDGHLMCFGRQGTPYNTGMPFSCWPARRPAMLWLPRAGVTRHTCVSTFQAGEHEKGTKRSEHRSLPHHVASLFSRVTFGHLPTTIPGQQAQHTRATLAGCSNVFEPPGNRGGKANTGCSCRLTCIRPVTKPTELPGYAVGGAGGGFWCTGQLRVRTSF